jgi:ankyrin
LEVIKYLLDAGFDIEKIDEKGCTPLMCAIREDRADTANLLIDRGADVSRPAKNGATPLHESISAGYLELTRLLIERGAPINARDAEGRTPLYLAIMYDLTKHVELLLEHGANPLQQTVFGHNAIHMTASKGRVEILELLAKNPSLQEIDVEDNNGFTPLLTAARHGNILVAEFLAKKGCDPNIEFEESISSWEIDLYDCAEVEDIRPLYIAYIKAGSLPSPIIFERMRSNYLYSGLAGLFGKCSLFFSLV